MTVLVDNATQDEVERLLEMIPYTKEEAMEREGPISLSLHDEEGAIHIYRVGHEEFVVRFDDDSAPYKIGIALFRRLYRAMTLAYAEQERLRAEENSCAAAYRALEKDYVALKKRCGIM